MTGVKWNTKRPIQRRCRVVRRRLPLEGKLSPKATDEVMAAGKNACYQDETSSGAARHLPLEGEDSGL